MMMGVCVCVAKVVVVLGRLVGWLVRDECVTWGARHAWLVCCGVLATHWPPLTELTEGQRRHTSAKRAGDSKATTNWRNWQLVVDTE